MAVRWSLARSRYVAAPRAGLVGLVLDDGGCEKGRAASHLGAIQYGRTAEKINPATIDLWLSLRR